MSSPAKPHSSGSLVRVVLGSATGTLIEWYDFYIFGALTSVLSVKFYPPENQTFALIAYLATFAAGFLVRPFGALFFGCVGDLVGRRIAFIFTLSIMGGATAAVGMLPTFQTAGWIAPIGLILIRLLQGLALGGEYGGAAVYLAEHVPDGRRGFYTSFLQTTAGLGMIASLSVILATEHSMNGPSFQRWGWRLPFLLSLIFVGISLVIRIRMKESPIFAHVKASGTQCARPLKEAFGNWANLRQVLVSLFGAAAGQAVVSYTGLFYALFYMQNILRINTHTTNVIALIGLAMATPTFILFGALSDRIGRKKVMLAGMLLCLVCIYPIYRAMQQAAGNNVVGVTSTKDPVTNETRLTPLTREGSSLVAARQASHPNMPLLILLICLQNLFSCMVYGPIAAYLVEAFPAKIRYTSVSLPYHLGNGIFGGLLPVIGVGLCAATGNLYAGLLFPMSVCMLSLVVGSLFLKESSGTLIWSEIESPAVSQLVLTAAPLPATTD
ncbi:MFS transporter [Occallatibacter savannae]|uniref:MFS transporter n=1 Tax=Occallatibacter savannae TaxID=1002691 RepID=UPI000D68A583|nr:MFS transporter [Occallatibacter savannae]